MKKMGPISIPGVSYLLVPTAAIHSCDPSQNSYSRG